MDMKLGFTAAAALGLVIAAAGAHAGVVISENVVVKQNTEKKTEQTVTIQGHKQKVIGEDQEFVTDMDGGKIYIIKPKARQYYESGFPPSGVVAMKMVMEGAMIELKKSGATHKVAGYACQDYTGFMYIPRHKLELTQCVASDAPGASEYMAFQKAMADKLKGKPLARKGQIPDGIPVSSILTMSPLPYKPPRVLSPGAAALMTATMAKEKPRIATTTVSKIEVKEVAADTFAVPSGYTKGILQYQAPHVEQKHGESPAASPAPH